jgi:hypothetical protein
MSVSQQRVDEWYTILYARHAAADEMIQWSTLSETYDVTSAIGHTAEAEQIIDPVLRLYLSAFHRVPDVADPNGNFDTGTQSGYWANVNAVRNGLSLGDLAEAFVASAEWKTVHGTTALIEPLISGLYNTYLHRTASTAEISAWMNTGLDTAHVLLGISESTEAKDLAVWKITEALKLSVTTASGHPDSEPFVIGLVPPGTFDPSPRPGGAFDTTAHVVGIADHPEMLPA